VDFLHFPLKIVEVDKNAFVHVGTKGAKVLFFKTNINDLVYLLFSYKSFRIIMQYNLLKVIIFLIDSDVLLIIKG